MKLQERIDVLEVLCCDGHGLATKAEEQRQGWKEWQDLGRQINTLEPVAVSQLPGKCSVELCGVPTP